MSTELILSIVSLCLSTLIGFLTILANIKISKINHLEAVKTYDKNITNFELQFKNEKWLYDILESGEFNNYNQKSKKRIYSWWIKYSKKYPPILLIPQIDYNDLRSPGPEWFGSLGGRNTEMVMPGDDLPNVEDLF